MPQNHCVYSLDMNQWINYLEIEHKYQNNKVKKKCLLFIFLWLRYNEFYNSKYPTERNDSIKATKLSENETCKQKYDELKEVFLEQFKQIGGADNPRTWIIDIKGNKKVYYKESHNTLKDFLTIIYKIRCNIFHGDKPPIDSNIKIIAWAYDCLNQLLNACNYWQS